MTVFKFKKYNIFENYSQKYYIYVLIIDFYCNFAKLSQIK